MEVSVLSQFPHFIRTSDGRGAVQIFCMVVGQDTAVILHLLESSLDQMDECFYALNPQDVKGEMIKVPITEREETRRSINIQMMQLFGMGIDEALEHLRRALEAEEQGEQVACSRCLWTFTPNLNTVEDEGYEVLYMVCPACGVKYIISVLDEELRKGIDWVNQKEEHDPECKMQIELNRMRNQLLIQEYLKKKGIK